MGITFINGNYGIPTKTGSGTISDPFVLQSLNMGSGLFQGFEFTVDSAGIVYPSVSFEGYHYFQFRVYLDGIEIWNSGNTNIPGAYLTGGYDTPLNLTSGQIVEFRLQYGTMDLSPFDRTLYFVPAPTPTPTPTPTPSPTSLKITTQPVASSSASLLSVQPVVEIVDQFGNSSPDSLTDVEVTLYVISGSATLSGTTTVTTSNGVAYFTDLVVTGSGSFYLHFESLIMVLSSTDSNIIFFTPDPGNPDPPIAVKPKRSYIAGSVPTINDLQVNEFAINVADKKGYMRDSNDVVHLLFDGYASGGGGGGGGGGSGTVTFVGLSSVDFEVSGSPIVSSGYIVANLNTQTLTAGTYGDASNVAEVTVNDKGIVTGIQNVAISYPVNSITAGTDISLTGTAPDYTINNTAPDQIVSITSGTGISVTGTYPNFTVDSTITQYTDADARLALSAGTGISYDNTTGVITNSEPDQIVGLTGGTDISITGTYPNFTIDYTGTNTGVTSIIAGTGISVDAATGAVTVTNTDPDQVVSLTAGTGISVTGTYPNFTIDSTITQYTDADARLSLSAGTGISYDNTTGVITNSDPDQIVSLTGGTDIGVTGTYPNFTIDYTGTAGTGTVTSVGITSTAAALTITNSPITTNGDIGVNFAGLGTEYVAGDGSLKTFPTTIDQALNLVTEVYNETGSTLTKGTVVYINGGHGNLPTVTKAQANNDANSAQTYGVVQSDISDQDNGYVVVAGRLLDLDTFAYPEGTQLYLSPTTAGAWTSTKPSAPNHLVYVGIVVRSHNTQGVVEIKIQNGYELHELHDVSITSVAPSDILRYNSSTKLWENVAGTTSSISEGSNLYYTDARARLSLSAGTGISYDNSTGVITNSSPDQTVVLTAGTGMSITGTYPSFTITNDDPDQTVSLTAGTGISVSGTYPSFTVTNSSPDQTVKITAGTGISVSGTYPDFTVTNSSPSSGGTVTSIATTSPITGGTITGSGTIGINASSTNTASYVVQRDASGNFAAGTITASLTGTASTATNIANGGAGQIPYNTGSGSTSFLAAGTSGQVLRSNGTAAPSWEVQGLFSGGRLTLTSGTPVTTSDVTAATTIYYTPYNGDKISLSDGTNWATYTFTERSLLLSGLTANRNYDVFLYNSAGTLTLEALVWNSSSDSNTRTTGIVLTSGGVYTKSGDATRRYLGTFRTTGTTGQTEDSNSKRFLWNYNNRVNRMLLKQYVASSWTWSGTANVYRYLGNNSANSVAFVNGFQEDNIFVMAAVGSSGSGIQRQLAIGFDSEWSSTLAGNSTSQYEATAVQAEASNESYQSFANRIAGLGYHVAYALELQNSTTTVNYFGGVEAGISGTWRC